VADLLLVRGFPNEVGQLILEFNNGEHRLFQWDILWEERGWKHLAYPQIWKSFKFSSVSITWPQDCKVNVDFLYDKSTLIQPVDLQHYSLRISSKNQAPTEHDKYHHVYIVLLAPCSQKPFILGQSIAGGHAERWYDTHYSLQELLTTPTWEKHFQLSGCSWASAVILSNPVQSDHLIQLLITEACQRNGRAESGYVESGSKLSKFFRRFMQQN
jgi:hypothetical protein